MSKPRITAAMLRPRTTTPRQAPQADTISNQAEPAAHHEAVASHPMFVAPQFGYRRNSPPGGSR